MAGRLKQGRGKEILDLEFELEKEKYVKSMWNK